MSDGRRGSFAEAQARTRASYDELPYVSHAFPQTHPARIAALGHLFGLKVPSLDKMRVLEIGCASGGNLIPLAVANPDGHFLGVDISGVQIEEGRVRIEELGLANIELRRQDITEFENPGHDFDFVICHGVYSWVGEAVRHKILEICSKYLKVEGISYVSFNVQPGWRPKQIVRDALMSHVGDVSNLRRRVEMAREFMGVLGDHVSAGPYGAAVKDGVAKLQAVDDYYLAHEFLELENHPCSFREFMHAASQHQLAFLGESDLHMMVPENFGDETARVLRRLGGNAQISIESYIDLLIGRPFRQSLLISSTRAAEVRRDMDPERIETLHLFADIISVPSSDPDKPYCFQNPAGRQIRTKAERVRKAFELMAARRPATSNLPALVAEIEAADGKKLSPEDRTEIRGALMQGILSGLIVATTQPVAVVELDIDRPKAIGIARKDAASGRTRTANRRHESVDLGPVAMHLLPVMDGVLDRSGLLDHLNTKVEENALHFERNGERITDEADIANCAEDHLAIALQSLRDNALLEP